MPAQTETRKILIKVDAPGVKEAVESVARSMGVLNKNTKSMASNMSLLSNAFRAWIGFVSVREIVGMSDSMQNLSNRLKLTAQAGENAEETFGKLAALADRQKLSIGAAGDVYNRFAISLGTLKPKSEEIIALSETLIASFRLAGATTTETANTMIQLSQAFSSGELRGQELRSVMEQNGVLAQLLTEKFGKGESVYKKAEKGLIGVTQVMELLFEHQEKLIEQAESMAPTFEQTLTKAMNTVAVQVEELNKKYELSAFFAVAMEEAVRNLSTVVTLVLVAAIGSAIQKFVELYQTLSTLSKMNVIILGLQVLAVLAVTIYNNWDRVVDLFDRLKIKALELQISITESLIPAMERLDKSFNGKSAQEAKERLAGLKAQLEALQSTKDDGYNEDLDAGEKLLEIEERQAAFASLIAKQKERDRNKERPLKEILGDLNKEYLLKKDINLYNKKLISFEAYKLGRNFKEGKMDIFAYRKQLEALDLQNLNRWLKDGEISWREYNNRIKENKLNDVTLAFQAGKISLSEYNEELLKLSNKLEVGGALYVGTEQYLKSIGTLSQNIAQGITDTFKHLEDGLVDFIKKGTFNFAKFTEAVMDDLLRIIIRASILRPLSEGLINAISIPTPAVPSGIGESAGGSIGAEAGASVHALGGAFGAGGARMFANGGVVGHPTMFRYGGNKTGIMGEAGPEAILPLQRGSGGKLGVAATTSPVIVNVINQSGAEAQQRETTGPDGSKVIEVLITNKVREGFATGKFDGAMKQNYGLTRRGS